METPPSPIGRAIASPLIAAVLRGAGLVGWGTIDIVASATGKIVPSGRTKVIQPFETGVVRAIQVQDGQAVKAGDVLIELDPTVNAAERDHLHDDLIAEQLNVARLRAALAAATIPPPISSRPRMPIPSLVATQRQLLANQVSEHRAKIAALARQQAQKEAEQATIAATIHKLDAMIPVIQQRVDIRKTLMEKEIGSKLTYYEILQLLVEQQEELSVQKQPSARSRGGRGRDPGDPRPGRGRVSQGPVRRTRQGRAESQRARAGPDQGASSRTRLQQLTAPVDGVVQQLAVHTVGGVVTPAQALLVIVPTDSRLEIEAMVSNRDIGFVQAGQDAEIKIDTFNFTRYGLLQGEVLSVSQDAIIRDQPQDRTGDRAAGGAERQQRAARARS